MRSTFLGLNELACSGLPNLTNKNTRHSIKCEFQVNTDDILASLYPMQHFITHSLPGHQKNVPALYLKFKF